MKSAAMWGASQTTIGLVVVAWSLNHARTNADVIVYAAPFLPVLALVAYFTWLSHTGNRSILRISRWIFGLYLGGPAYSMLLVMIGKTEDLEVFLSILSAASLLFLLIHWTIHRDLRSKFS